ncbi:LysR family transcriptional regulator [Neobacillus sp. NRS-1170]|uniref:LysR family transcriptional regulator n=1 Tax=Neobacillus sp. NRS-1170 TaxID=3233898 RepID=UPI003D2AC7D6
MDIRLLRYFESIVRHRNITKAAEELQISQPSLSIQMKALEQELGCKLIDRSARDVLLTEPGEVLYTHTLQILQQISNAYKEIDDIKEDGLGEIRIGSISTCTPWLFNLFLGFKKKYPMQQINIKEMHGAHIEKALLSYDIHIGLTSTTRPSNLLSFEPIYCEELVLITSIEHRFKDLDEIDFKHLADEPLISNPSSYALQKQILFFCNQAGFTPKFAFEIDGRSIPRFVSAGLGIAIVPRSSLTIFSQDGFIFKVITLKNPSPSRIIYLATHQNRYFSEKIDEFRSQIVRVFK